MGKAGTLDDELAAAAAKVMRERVAAALRACGGHVGQAAAKLGRSRRMVTYYLAQDSGLRRVAEEARVRRNKKVAQ